MYLKKRIGKKAAEFAQNDSSIILDSGTTVTEIARALTSANQQSNSE